MKLKENNIIKLSLIIFLFLFILLYYLDSIYSPTLINIKDIDKSYYNKIVKINTKIEKLNLNNETLFLVLSDLNNSNYKINAIIFKTKIILDMDKNYEFIGRISLYKNELELLVDKIKEI